MVARAGLGGALATAMIFYVLAASAFAALPDLDTTFGASGVTAGPVAGGTGFVADGTLRPDGSTVMVGNYVRGENPFIVTHDVLGQRAPDQEIDLPSGYVMQRVAFAPDAIYLAGTAPGGDAFVARAGYGGALDPQFGDVATPGIGDLSLTDITRVAGLALQDLGDALGPRPVVLVDRTNSADFNSLVRLTPSGRERDATFATEGVQVNAAGTYGVDLVATDAGIWALGAPATLDSFVLARFAAADGVLAPVNGRVDGTFPETAGATRSVPNSLAVDDEGRAYVAGRLETDRTGDYAAIVRFTATSTRDLTFGTDALFTTAEAGVPLLLALTVDAEGILAGGSAESDGVRVGRTLVVDRDGKQLLATLRTGAAGDSQHRFVSRYGDGRPVVGGSSASSTLIARFGGPNLAPTVTLTGPAKARPSETFTLTATGTDADGTGGGLRYEWDVDGRPGFETSTGTRNTLDTSVAATGPFTARVRVTDASGKVSGVAEHSLTIAGNAVPVAAFTFTPSDPTAGRPVDFDASASADADGLITAYAWDFTGDGTTDATGPRTSFAYGAKGVYTATLTVTDDTGATAERSREIMVAAAGGPPVLSDLEAVDVTSTSATLRFRVTENGHPAVDPEVEVGSRRFAATATGTPGVFAAKVTDLFPLTSYFWRPRVTDAETGGKVDGPLGSFKTSNAAPTMTAAIPTTAQAGGPFEFSFEAHDDATPDDKLKVSMKLSQPPAAAGPAAVFKGGRTEIKDVRFATSGKWRIDLVATDQAGATTAITGIVDVKPTPSFSLDGPTTEVALAPGKTRSLKIQIERDAQGTAPVKLEASSAGAPGGATVKLSDDKAFTSKKSATLDVRAPVGSEGKTFKVKIQGTQKPEALRNIGPRTLTIPFRVIETADLVLDDVQVLQAVGKPQAAPPGKYSGVTLSAGKTTLVRAFAHYSNAKAPSAPPAASLVVKYKNVTKGPIAPVFAPAVTEGAYDLGKARFDPSGAYLWVVPPSVTKAAENTGLEVDFKVTLTPPVTAGGLPVECAGCAANNERVVKDVGFLGIRSFSVNVLRADWTDRDGKVNTLDPWTIDATMRRPGWVLPVADAAFKVKVPPVVVQLGKGGAAYCADQDAQDAIQIELGLQRTCRKVTEARALDALRFTMFLNNISGPTLALNSGFSPGVALPSEGIAIVNAERPLTSVTHELMHIIGRDHADIYCGGNSNGQEGSVLTDDRGSLLEAFGLRYFDGAAPWKVVSDPQDQVDAREKNNPAAAANKSEFEGHDLMSYCATEGGSWTSLPGWTRNISLLRFGVLAQRAAPRQAAAAGAIRVLALSTDDNAKIVAVRPAAAGEPAPAGAPTDFAFVARDAGGTVLGQVPAVRIEQDEPHDDTGSGNPIGANLPPGTVAVDVVRGNQVLDTRSASPTAPTVQVLSPQPGAMIGGGRQAVEVTWTAADPDGDPLDALVEYSSDGGATWKAVFNGIGSGTLGSAQIDPAALAATNRAKLRITVTDGFRAATAESGLFTSRPPKARVRILEPGPRVRPKAGLTLSATAAGYAPDGARYDDSAYRWFLGKRMIGRGASILTPPLPAGTSKLRVVAGKASASRTLRAAGVKPFFTKLAAKRRGRKARVTVATSAPGSVRIAGRRYAVSPRAKTLKVRAPRRAKRLPVTLTATGRTIRAAVRLR